MDGCAFSFELARKDSVERNSEAKINPIYEYVSQVVEPDVDYFSNWVLIAEIAFNIMKRSGGWLLKMKRQ